MTGGSGAGISANKNGALKDEIPVRTTVVVWNDKSDSAGKTGDGVLESGGVECGGYGQRGIILGFESKKSNVSVGF